MARRKRFATPLMSLHLGARVAQPGLAAGGLYALSMGGFGGLAGSSGMGMGMGLGMGMEMCTMPESLDDRHMLVKDQSISPSGDELAAMQRLVSYTEKALKIASDQYLAKVQLPAQQAASEAAAAAAAATSAPCADLHMELELPELSGSAAGAPPSADAKSGARIDSGACAGGEEKLSKEPKEKLDEKLPQRVIRGVMRVGPLANGLLIRSDLNLHLVLLCAKIPTRSLLEFVYKILLNYIKASPSRIPHPPPASKLAPLPLFLILVT